jgi:hypothetical protein
MKSSSSEHDRQDEKLIDILKDLGSFRSTYPSELLASRRASFIEQVEGLSPSETVEEFSPGDREIVNLLEQLRSVRVEYPADLLAARRSAFLRQMERARGTSSWNRFRVFLQRLFLTQNISPSPSTGFLRISLVVASFVVILCIGVLFLSLLDGALRPAPSQVAAAPTGLQPTSTAEVAVTICGPGERTAACPSVEFDTDEDLANAGNGVARPAVSKDTRSHQNGVYKAAYVNDGRAGASWVGDSADSWIKIDLGKVTTINTVSLQRGSPDSPGDGDLGPFEVAVAVADEYADGDSSHDYAEYAQVFHSEQTGLPGPVSPAETIQIRFPLVQARFIKITFEKAGAAVEEVGVFMVEPRFAAQPTGTPLVDAPEPTLTSATNTPSLMGTATFGPTGTSQPTGTTVPTLSKTPSPSGSPILPPTNTISPTDTPVPLPTIPPPTTPPPTIVPPTEPLPTISTDPIVVTEHDQTLTFICDGNAAEIRGNRNTVTLLGSCSSITVTGNRNHVYWQFGSPVITIRGKDNIVEQL